ncbi:MAG: hypothetical protein DMG24_18755 [Acidobacteria bacterium]|nr:MAG: hypothetical protein DMG24_18755 [Acidobacteriota bacterium]
MNERKMFFWLLAPMPIFWIVGGLIHSDMVMGMATIYFFVAAPLFLAAICVPWSRLRMTVERFNGWQRLWVMLSVLWLIPILSIALSQSPTAAKWIIFLFLGWLLPVISSYGLGLMAAWVIRGFRQ